MVKMIKKPQTTIYAIVYCLHRAIDDCCVQIKWPFSTHRRTLTVPAWEAVAPGAGPAHDVFGLCLLPECEVCLVALLAYAVELSRCVFHVVEVAAREYAVVVLLVIFLYVEIDRTVAYVCKAVVEYLLHKLLLLYDVARSVRLNAGWQHVEGVHGGVVAVGVVLRYLHWFELLEARLLLYLVIAVIAVVLQVSHVGDVAHVAHLVADVFEVAEEYVKRDGGTRVSQMRVAVDGRSADVHAHIGCMQRFEQFFLTRECVVYD